MHHDIAGEITDVPLSSAASSEQRAPADLFALFALFSDDVLRPIAALSSMHLAAIIEEDEGIFPESAPAVCLAARLESKTRTICRRSHQDLRAKARGSFQLERSTCPFGLELFCIPVALNGRLYGFLEGGRVFRGHKMTDETVEPLRRVLRRSRWSAMAQGLSESYLGTALVKNADFNLWIRVLSALAGTLASKAAKLNEATAEAQHPGILKALAYVRQHLDEPLTPAQVARAANVSNNYFSKLFKRETGMHFSEFLARERVAKACRLLRETGQTVSEIAFAVGFDSVPYFNRCFKAWTKTSLRAYRLDGLTPSGVKRESEDTAVSVSDQPLATILENS